MSIHIELRNTEGFLDRFKKSSAPAGPKTTMSDKVAAVTKGFTKAVGKAGQGIASGAADIKNDTKCEMSLRKLQAAPDSDIPNVMSAVDEACGPAKNKYCKKFEDAKKGRKPDAIAAMDASREHGMCS